MSASNESDIAILNELIETCRDGSAGFRTASAAVTNTEAQNLFRSRAEVIDHSAQELQSLVTTLGGKPETTGHVAAAIHRGWIDLKAAVTGRNEAAVMTECERGEQVAVTAYEAALKKDLSPAVRIIVDRQYHGAVQNLERVRAMARRVGADHPSIAPTPTADHGAHI